MFKKYLTLLCVLMFIGTNYAQSVWTDVPESGIPAAGDRRIQPSKFRSMHLDVSAMKNLLVSAPERFTPAAEASNWPVISVPLPGGGVGRFQMEETPVMHPDLQAKFPQIRTYTGRGMDDPTAVLKCDLTPFGFHAMVHSSRSGTYFVDPAIYGNDAFYVVYNKADYQHKKNDLPWSCGTPDPENAQELVLNPDKTPIADFQGDTKLRRYRLALACTGEYATFQGGTLVAVLAAMNTTMNRVNGVYERDFAVTMQIIPNNSLLVFFNAATDPYTNDDAAAMLNQNQTTCNNLIGAANYDIGHVFGAGDTGGIAGLGVVCGTTKANGVTGNSAPVGDPFDIDYVAHEMGHQFGGNHTYGNCGGAPPSPKVEPGSGTTIMAYAGICGAQDIAPHSDDFFHGYSITEMGGFIYTGQGNTCPVKITTTNHNPTVNGGSNRTIPKSTPFALTATGADIDGDTLTYTWEQIDNATATSPPVSTNTVGAMFRSYKGSASPTRYFPRLQDIVNNANPAWEKLPSVARNMNFRVVARDNDWQAGCTAEDDVQVTVSATSGPFLVTAPNTNVTWFVGNTQTVTWNVANTTAAPVSCANVRITLSTDGGFTYPIELAASVPNNGTYDITVPNNPATTCRVKVESVGNIFFDISNTNFKIELPPSPTYLLGTSVSALNICAGETGAFSTNVTSLVGFNTPVSMSITGAPAGATVDITPNPVTPSGTAMVNISDLTPAMAGTYTLTVTATGGAITKTASVNLTVLPGIPNATTTLSPAHGETGVAATAQLVWNAGTFAGSYLVEVATNPAFAAGDIVSSQTVSGTSASVVLQIETVYYWRVRTSNDCGIGAYSATAAFQTGKNLCNQNFNSTDVPKTIPVAATVDPIISTLSVASTKRINDVNLSVAFTHTYVGDLSAWLISPGNDTLQLFEQPGDPAVQYGCPGDNGNLIFDDQAAQDAAALEVQCNNTIPSLTGTFKAIQSFSPLVGKVAAGQWKFVMVDNYPSEDGGAITSWGLSFCFPDSIAPGNLLANNPLLVLTGQSGTLEQVNLDQEISGTANQALYTLLSLPQHGTLALNGTPLAIGGSFTQADINNNLVTYTSNGDAAFSDDFHFDALDQNNDAWVHDAVFNINILDNDLAAAATQTGNILCANENTGQITVAATGLNGTYSYSLNGGAAQNSNVFDGLAAGTYTVVVSGQFGLTIACAPVTIANPAAIAVSTSVAGDVITVTASGGSGNLEYSLNGMTFQSSNEFLDVPNGVYTVTVQDNNGCTATAEAIVAFNALLVNSTIQTQLSCFGGTNGSIVVTVGGGEMPFSYSLNGGTDQASNVFNDLPSGTYTVIVTDNLGLSATSNTVILNDPAAILASASATLNVVTVVASGGTGALQYSKDGMNFQASNLFLNLPNGVYTISVKDSKGCIQTTEVTVDVPALSGSLQTSSILCFGGTITLTVDAANGIPPYEYKLNNGSFQSSNTFAGLGAGSYTATIRDASGTILVLDPVVIAQPDLLQVAVTVTGNDGAVNTTGGVAPYVYTTNAPNIDLQNLPNGTYSLSVTDANGCISSTTFTVNVPPLTASFVTQNILCNGEANGSATLTGIGGIPPYTYSFNGMPFGNTNVFTNLAAGSYPFTVQDADGTQLNSSVTVTEPPVLTVNATVTGTTINAVASGGKPNYKYSLNGGAPQNSGTFSGLAPGTYTVVSTDANGCTATIGNLVVMQSATIEPTEVWGLAVSPNPSTGLFVLNLQNAPDALQAQVFDATGRLLQSLELHPLGTQFSTTIDLQDLPQGTYLLRLSDGKQWGGVRLVKMGN